MANWSTLAVAAKATAVEVLFGFVLAAVVGIAVALVIVRFERFGSALYPLVVLFQNVPKVALAPIFILWFGYDLAPKVVLIVVIAFFPVAIDMLAGLQSVEPSFVALMRSVGASRSKIMSRVRIPHSLPHLMAGLKVAITFSVIGAIVGEFAGAIGGLGYVIQFASTQLDTPLDVRRAGRGVGAGACFLLSGGIRRTPARAVGAEIRSHSPISRRNVVERVRRTSHGGTYSNRHSRRGSPPRSRCGSAALAADKVTVQLDYVVRGNHAMFFVAKEKGYFARSRHRRHRTFSAVPDRPMPCDSSATATPSSASATCRRLRSRARRTCRWSRWLRSISTVRSPCWRSPASTS